MTLVEFRSTLSAARPPTGLLPALVALSMLRWSGWNGYVDKDLRTLLGRRVNGKFNTRFCGQGNLDACRGSLWAALDAAGTQLAAAQGPDPAAWRQSATGERIRFAPGLLPTTMRWTNRPTFHLLMEFGGHR